MTMSRARWTGCRAATGWRCVDIDDDLLALTPLKRNFDLVCTAQRAGGYKPMVRYFAI